MKKVACFTQVDNAFIEALRGVVETIEMTDHLSYDNQDMIVMTEGWLLGVDNALICIKKWITNGTKIMVTEPTGQLLPIILDLCGIAPASLKSKAVIIAGTVVRKKVVYHFYNWGLPVKPNLTQKIVATTLEPSTNNVEVKDYPVKQFQSCDRLAEDNFKQGLENFLANSALLIKHHVNALMKKDTESADEPISNLYGIWNDNHPIYISDPDDQHGYTPQAQTASVTNATTITGYLDETSTGENFQWLTLEVNGYLSVGTMLENNDKAIGWANGAIILNIGVPEGFNVYSVSPTTPNNDSTYTSGWSFSVGVEAGSEGGNVNTSVEVSNSTTVDLTDWTFMLTATSPTSSWTFEQSSPWTGINPDMHDVAKSAVSLKLQPLPALSTNVVNYVTSCVYQNHEVMTNTVTIPVTAQYKYNYVASNNGYILQWGWYAPIDDLGGPFQINLSYLSSAN